jgi:hypothetical protein
MINKIKAFFAKNVIEADDNSLSGDQQYPEPDAGA